MNESMAASPTGAVGEDESRSHSLSSSVHSRGMLTKNFNASWISRNDLSQEFFPSSISHDHHRRPLLDLDPSPINFTANQPLINPTQHLYTPYAGYHSTYLPIQSPSMLLQHQVGNPAPLEYFDYDFRPPTLMNNPFDSYQLASFQQANVVGGRPSNLSTFLYDGLSHFGDTANGLAEPESPYSTSPSLEYPSAYTPWTNSPQYVQHESASDAGQDTIKREHGGEDNSGDKPYARLIHEALMQAPGHRMMLREIYDWFLQNTTKPQESGTNGWQNSIRHNLSMNQAFENDKSELNGARGHSRKANSVWILTEYAVKNGVQSTTRYRKHGGSKRGGANRAPAVQRQRSGAKGGRAACRAARLRRQEQHEHRSANYSPGTPSSMSSLYGYTSPSQAEYTSAYTYSPVTPTGEFVTSDQFPPPHMPYYGSGGLGQIKTDYDGHEEELQGYMSTQLPDSAMEEMLRLHMDSSNPDVL